MGDSVKISRWFSVWDIFRDRLKKECAFITMILVFKGLHSTWANEAADLFALAMCGTVTSSLTTTTLPQNAEVPRSVSESSRIFQQLRSSCMGNEHTAAVTASNQIGYNVMRGLHIWVEVVRKRHGEAMQAAHDPEKAMDWRTADALGAWQDELAQMAAQTEDANKLEEAGFLPADYVTIATDTEKSVDKDIV